MGYSPHKEEVRRKTVGLPAHVVDSSLRYSRPSWNVVSSDQRGVSHATIGCGLRWRSVVKRSSSRCVPVPSWTYPQRPATRASPRRDQGPVPVPISRSLVVPPYHATVRRVRWVVGATTAWGAASCWPLTRGRPIVVRVRGGGGSSKAASPQTLLPTVR